MIVCRVRPRKGVKLQAFWANRSKNLALWCRKWREGNTIFEQCGNQRSVNYLILNVFFSSLLVKWKLFVLSWLFQQTLFKEMAVISLVSILGYLLPVSYLLKINFQRSLFLIISSIITLGYIFSFLDILSLRNGNIFHDFSKINKNWIPFVAANET